MESWPVDLRPTVATDRRTANRRSEANKPIESRNALDFGSRGGAAIRRRQDGALEWRFAANFGKQGKRWSSDPDSIVKLFPDTAPRPLPVTRSRARVTADNALSFMHAHYPDIMGLPANLLEDEISADITVRQGDPFDVYRGNRLAVCPLTDQRDVYGYVAWAMGYNVQSLNVVAVLRSGEDPIRYKLEPGAAPLVTLDTPIQQVTMKEVPSETGPVCLLGVRTISGSRIFQVNAHRYRPSSLALERLGELTSKHTNGRRHVDLAIDSSAELHVVVVDDEGTVYRWSTEQLGVFSPPRESRSDNRLYRIVRAPSEETVILASDSRLQLLDFRTSDFTTLYETAGFQTGSITSLEAIDGTNMVCLATTEYVSWIDVRYPGRSLLSWRHHRAWDRTISSYTIANGLDWTTFLWSRTNPLVTIYDLDAAHDSLSTTARPYTLSETHVVEGRSGFSVLPGSSANSMLLFDLHEQGSVYLRELRPPCSEQEDQAISITWSPAVHELDEDSKKLTEDLGPFGERASVVIDMTAVYEQTMLSHASSSATSTCLQTVANVLQKMPSIVQYQDADTGHLLTTFDLAFLAEDKHPEPRRSDFLAGTSLSRIPAPADWLLNKITDMKLPSYAAWSTSHSALFNQIPPLESHASETNALHYLMKDSRLAQSPSIPSARETEAANAVALDLGLSQTVYSSEAIKLDFAESKTVYDDLESATGALSLADPEPPAMTFGYLRPRQRPSPESADPDSQATQVAVKPIGSIDAGVGARLLLSEWIPGTNPDAYEYVDPYGVAEPGDRVTRTPRQKTAFEPAPGRSHSQPELATGPPLMFSTQPIQPPLIISTQAPPVLSTQPLPRAPFPSSPVAPRFSQFPRSQRASAIPASSQEMWPSTQQVPGPFGQRPEAQVAKRKAKKRMAGF